MERLMPNFESPIGSKTFHNQPLRELEVPSEEQFKTSVARKFNPHMFSEDPEQEITAKELALLEQEKEIKRAKEEKKNQVNRLNPGAKKRLEMLVGMTSYLREVDINGHVYVLKTMKDREYRDAVVAISKYDGTVQFPFESRRQMLARSLSKIANIDFEEFIGSSDIEDKLSFIDELHDGILDRLFTEYKIMMQEYRDKYSIKNVEDAKGVVEDLKK